MKSVTNQYNILVVDDEESNLKFLERTLRSKFNVLKALSAAEALEITEKETIDLVISDFKMPEMNGIEFLSRIKKIQPNTVRILLTAYTESDILLNAINTGGVYRYIKKPCDPENVRSIVEAALEVYQLDIDNKNLTKDFNSLFSGTVKSIVEALDAKDSFTSGRSKRVASLALEIGKELKLANKDLIKLEVAGLLHDIGMIGVPEHILHKEERLNREEFEQVKKHVEYGIDILSEIKHLASIVNIIKYHHERFDGKGYPYGVAGHSIPLLSRIITVVDAYDGMLSDRAYRKKMSTNEAIIELEKMSSVQFDPIVVNSLINVLKNA